MQNQESYIQTHADKPPTVRGTDLTIARLMHELMISQAVEIVAMEYDIDPEHLRAALREVIKAWALGDALRRASLTHDKRF